MECTPLQQDKVDNARHLHTWQRVLVGTMMTMAMWENGWSSLLSNC